jgi:EAL domain-containing protein (putative c-di-GMP-specific phosphodiesterase class I)
LLHRRRPAAASQSAVYDEYTFFTVFQPIVDLATDAPVGYEALTRFADGQSPLDTLAEANDAGVGAELDAAMAVAALASAHALPSGAWLAINVSFGLANQPERFAAIVADAPCPLVIEVGESVEMAHLLDGRLTTANGVMLAIDDAGAGYESLARIEQLRPSFMKLHREAVAGIELDTARQAFVRTLVEFADDHGCQIIAEGVETEAERDALRSAGVHLGQGYFVGRPVPIDRMDTTVG